MTRTLKIYFHDRCFDGVSSAAMFSRFYREAVDRHAEIVPVGMEHRDGDPFEGVALDADDHACVDFRYCPAERMRWWFDHHATAFQPASLRAIFDERRLATHVFDPHAPSCAGLMAAALPREWGWPLPPHLRELSAWADRVDALDYASAAEAVALSAPAQRVSTFLASSGSDAAARCIRWLETEPLDEVARRPEVDAAAQRALAERDQTLAHLRQIAKRTGDVVTLDLLATPGSRSPGLLGYLLFPTCHYVVSAVVGPATVRISVGHNPWVGAPSRVHVGQLCERHGGGGHAGVGGITLEPHEVARAAGIVRELVRTLSSG
ncbi:MAG: hypothetical protein R3B48_18645 [Kofleriaceae bacterium]